MTPLELSEACLLSNRIEADRGKLAIVSDQWRIVYQNDRGQWPPYLNLSQAQVNAIIKPLIQPRIDAATARLLELGVIFT